MAERTCRRVLLSEPLARFAGDAYRQVGDVIAKVLNFTADEANREALRAALSYYVASNDVDVELSVSIPVSGLQLLSYYRFVTELKQYSQSKWDDLTTEAQIRLLIEHLKVDTSVPTHFQHLAKLQAELAITGPKRDVLGLIIKMRNVVTHPRKTSLLAFRRTSGRKAECMPGIGCAWRSLTEWSALPRAGPAARRPKVSQRAGPAGAAGAQRPPLISLGKVFDGRIRRCRTPAGP